MSSNPHSSSLPALDLSKWRNLPVILMVVGAIVAVAGLAIGGGGLKQFGYSWLLAFMFSLSLCLGAWFMVMMHHLFDASWSVPTRRLCEHMSCLLFPTMFILMLPIAFTAKSIYPWMATLAHPDHALKSKYPLFTMPGYYVLILAIFGIWWLYSNRLRHWSLRQDETGGADCTHRMRFYAASGVVLFAVTVTLASIVWMKGLMDEWYSTMYGVWYFAASVWVSLPTIYVITLVLQRVGPLRNLVREHTYYMIGSLFFAFTVFWGYVSFAQYFIVWNANMPEETFWYVLREKGTWDVVGKYVIIFGHFFVPFLMLLRIDWKLKLRIMLPLAIWAWLMHFVDIEFQIMPSLHPDSILTSGLVVDFACVLFFIGVLMKVFIASLNCHPVYPLRDPRMAEAMGVYVPPLSHISIAPERAK
jgi:hypothetical protein